VQNNGNVATMTASGAQSWSRTYSYDELNRIKAMSASGVACSGLAWTYDAWGNRLSQGTTGGTCGNSNPTINTQNRIVDAGYSYDAAGNLTAEPGKTYQWDAESRMVSINNSSTASYKYDPSGRRVEKNSGGVRTQYVYGAGGVVAEWVNGAQPMQGTWTVGYIYFSGQMVAQYSDGTTYFVHKDHLGSTRVLTPYPYTGAVSESVDYLPFGEQIAGGSTTSRKFTGKERDVESGLDYLGARYYTSLTGRFISPDLPGIDQHLTNPQTLNLYVYARNNPLAFTDPSGHAAEDAMQFNHITPMESGMGMNSFGNSTCMACTEYEMKVGNEEAFAVFDGIREQQQQTQQQAAGATIGIGIEVPADSAVSNNTLNAAADPGHTFVYFRDASGTITALLSFGPGEPIGATNKQRFTNGDIPGNANWPLGGNANTWEFRISSAQMNAGVQAIAQFRQNVPNYTPTRQCTSAAVTIAKRAGVNLPTGVGPVIARAYGRTLYRANTPNPYHLNRQMTARYGAPTVVNTSVFTFP
jgi:RHS repeat-associated protein